MAAKIVYLAEVRARRAKVKLSFVVDPFAGWQAWASFWFGGLR